MAENKKYNPTTLNQYQGTNDIGEATVVVAPSMTVAASVYNAQKTEDPVVLQCVQKGILCVLPDSLTSFVTEVTDPTNTAKLTCRATPEQYVVVAGTTQIFTASPADGFEFVKWSINGTDVAGDEGTKPVAMLTIPASPNLVTIKAHFQTVVKGGG